jgi:hypothetical protein
MKSPPKVLAVALVALLAIGQIVRGAFVAAFADDQPDKAARIWGSHPAVLFKTSLNDIAASAAQGRDVPRDWIDAVYAAYYRSPLSPEPFLVRGVDAQLGGKADLAGRSFEAARRRDPRSLAAHYFLADHYLRTNRPDAGLVELARLTKLVPKGIESVAPYYAKYAASPGGAAAVKKMLRINPAFEPDILAALAGDPANADLILFLASGSKKTSGEPPAWHGRLVQSLIDSRQYAKAKAVWSKLSGTQLSDSGLFDAGFTGKKAAPPFNWSLLSNSSGVAEPQADGHLHLVYYGRDNVALASQTLMLSPGSYRFSFDMIGTPQNAAVLGWTITCLPTKAQIASLPLAASGPRSVAFNVGGDCPVQLLSLFGTSPEFPETADVTIGNLALVRVPR